MSRAVAVLRPEPGNAVTVARVEAAGLTAISLPLFAVQSLGWTAPNPTDFDALILTSANAPRLAGPSLDVFAHLPIFAVGPATAAAARERGLTVAETGDGDGADLTATMTIRGFSRALLLTGREHALHDGGIIARSIAVYAADPIAVDTRVVDALADSVALLHSIRAARRFAEIIGAAHESIRIAAISDAVAEAAGPGWAHVAAASQPRDDALVALARRLAD